MHSFVRSTQAKALPVLIALSIISMAAAPSETLTHLFAEANASYQKGDYSLAERLYQQLLEKGIDSGVVFYNLGNACFKQKKLGEAIYFWEEASRRLPGDPDIRENLDYASLLVVDRMEVPPDPIPLRWMDNLLHRLTIGQDSWIAALLFATANLMFTGYLLAKSPRLALRALISSVTIGSVALLFACSMAWKVYEKSYRLEGVVVEQKADVRSGPGNENITVFTVHEGILLRVRGETAGWYQISLPNGWSGWLPRNSVRVL